MAPPTVAGESFVRSLWWSSNLGCKPCRPGHLLACLFLSQLHNMSLDLDPHIFLTYKRVLTVSCWKPEWENVKFAGHVAVAFIHLPTMAIFFAYRKCFRITSRFKRINMALKLFFFKCDQIWWILQITYKLWQI